MSVITSMKKQAVNLTRKALRIGGDFTHPIHNRTFQGPDYNQLGEIPAQEPNIKLPNSHEWGPGFPTTTFIDPQSGLLTSRTDGLPSIEDGTSIYDLYAERAERMGDDPLYTFKQGNQWISVTAKEFLMDVRAVAKGLMHYGITSGDAVAFMCRTSYEWDLTDAAVMACGGVLATIYDTDSTDQIRNIINNSDARLLIVETRQMREQADGAEDDCPTLERVMCIANGALDELKAYGSVVGDEELDQRIDSVKKTDLCSIVYTSGSTAAPKGVEMTHEHYCTTAKNLRAYMPDMLGDRKLSVLLFLPQAHTFARAVNYILVASDLHIYIAQGIATLITDFQVAKPAVTIVVPRVLEKVYNAASQKAGNGARGIAFAAAVVTAQHYMKKIGDDGRVDFTTRTKHAMFDPLVYKPLREVLGGKAQWFVTGGAPLDPDLLAFFRGAFVPVYEGYGLTETTAPCSFNPPGTPFHEGSVGIPFPGFSIRIADDGEIQIKGLGVFHRYHKNDDATEMAFTSDGWYVTGDLGRLSNDGFLYITGRKKDLIITAGGKNVAPSHIEEIIQRCPFVSQALVLGDKRPFISALVTLDEEATRSWLTSQGLDSAMPMEQAAENAVVRSKIQEYVDLANEGVSRAESIRKFIVLPKEFTQKDGLMTASMKIIRPKVIERYENLLDTRMYTKHK